MMSKTGGVDWNRLGLALVLVSILGVGALVGVVQNQNTAVLELLRIRELGAHAARVGHTPVVLTGAGTSRAGTGSSSGSGFLLALKSRDEFGAELERRGYTTGIELGVQVGLFALQLLNTWPSCKQYYLVDIWQHQKNYEDSANVPQEEQDKLFTDTKDRLKGFASKTIFLRNYTSEAINAIPGLVDFVYVDARHDYCGAAEDVKLYWAKIRSGGMMAGHDFIEGPEVTQISNQHWEKCHNGTINDGAARGAVIDFFQQLGLPVLVTYRDGPWNSWMVLKP